MLHILQNLERLVILRKVLWSLLGRNYDAFQVASINGFLWQQCQVIFGMSENGVYHINLSVNQYLGKETAIPTTTTKSSY